MRKYGTERDDEVWTKRDSNDQSEQSAGGSKGKKGNNQAAQIFEGRWGWEYPETKKEGFQTSENKVIDTTQRPDLGRVISTNFKHDPRWSGTPSGAGAIVRFQDYISRGYSQGDQGRELAGRGGFVN